MDDGVARSDRIKQGDGPVQVHTLKHLYTLELSLSPDVEVIHPSLSLLRLLGMTRSRVPLPETRILFTSVLSPTLFREIWTCLFPTSVMNGYISGAWE